MQFPKAAAWLLDGLTISLSFRIRYKVILFVRYNPWGNLLLEEIFLLSFIYVALWLAQWFLWKNQLISSTTKQKPVAAGDAIQSGNFWIAVITGRFDPSLQAWGFASLLTTSLFPFMTVDFIYRSYILHGSSNLTFSRMGYISDTSAKVVVRYPIATNIEIEYRANSDGMTSEPNSWSKGQTLYTAPLDDFITTFELKYLQPETEYEYRTNASHSGIFSTPPSNPKRLTLVSSSCIKPSFPYNPFGHSLGIKGLSHLSNYLKTTKADMMFFLGDFIYIDLPKRFGYDAEDYQRAYRQVYASPNWSEGLKSMARIHAYDDHEITNNWSGNETGIFKQAIRPFGAYLHHGNPDPVKKGAMYYAFSRGDVSFFVMDTRRYRSPEMMPDGEHKTMLGAEQLAVFKNWLRTTPGWKVVLSSVPFTRNFRAADEEDYWAGYLYEREELLKIMWQTEGVLIITGDRHEHATTAFPPPGTNDTRVIEFSTSPLSQFVNPFVKDYRQIEDSDLAINYHHEGLSKFGSFTFDTSDPRVWKMGFELIVDGVKVWNYTVEQHRRKAVV